MAKIEIYTKITCPFCHAAKDLLAKKGADFHEVDINKQPDQRDTMIARAGGMATVPQIFIDGTHVGGCDELYALESKGGLDVMLAG